MSFWPSFLVGIGTGGGLVTLLLWLLLNVASSTPEMALSSLAACLRGFARRLEHLHVVVVVEGARTLLPFDQIVRAIERAELSMYRCSDGSGAEALSADPPPISPADPRPPTPDSPP